MASKELIAELGEVLFQAEYGEDAGKTCYLKNHYEKLARSAIATILAAQLDYARLTGSPLIDEWIKQSPLGEQSE